MCVFYAILADFLRFIYYLREFYAQILLFQILALILCVIFTQTKTIKHYESIPLKIQQRD